MLDVAAAAVPSVHESAWSRCSSVTLDSAHVADKLWLLCLSPMPMPVDHIWSGRLHQTACWVLSCSIVLILVLSNY